MLTQRPPTIDPQAASHWQQQAPSPSPWLHEEVGRHMEERLAWIKRQPTAWAHWEPVNGGLQTHQLIVRRYPQATCHVTEFTPERASYAQARLRKPWWTLAGWKRGPARFDIPPESSVQMLWSNMALHMAADPQALIGQWHRALKVDGFVMFSCLGPDTLSGLREVYRAKAWPAPTHQFTDMHDWGDMLVQAGFAEPVMDMERITLSFATAERLLEELRGLGRNLQPQRFAALRGRQWRRELLDELGRRPLQLEFEVIYGHAFKPSPRLSVRPETVLSLAQMRDTLRPAKSRPAGG